MPHPAMMVVVAIAMTPFGTAGPHLAITHGIVMAVQSPISVHVVTNHDGLRGRRSRREKGACSNNHQSDLLYSVFSPKIPCSKLAHTTSWMTNTFLCDEPAGLKLRKT